MAAIYDAILFTPTGKAAPMLLAFWRAREPLQPLQAAVELLNADATGNESFRRAWQGAFPDRDPLPTEPLAERDGRGTEALWTVFA
jgi:hypothetical protein